MDKFIYFYGKHIDATRIISMHIEDNKVFPYYTLCGRWRWTNKFPFIKQWRKPVFEEVTKAVICIELDNGKVFKQMIEDGCYSSHTNAESALSTFKYHLQNILNK